MRSTRNELHDLRRASVIAAALLAALPAFPRAQAPALDQLLEDATAHIRVYVRQLANIVCGEEYVQERRARPALSRRLTSDFLLVEYPPVPGQWMIFRDVRAVDGVPLAAEQQERILDLFVRPRGDAAARAEHIAGEGRRHHLPGVSTAVDDPLRVIAVLQDLYRDGFQFRLGGEDRSLGPGVWIMRFEQRHLAWFGNRTDRPHACSRPTHAACCRSRRRPAAC